ncbi:MAG: Fic family protein [Victivallaceae bacterium]|nr:Fic family protein [Victivallaceae bacterium]
MKFRRLAEADHWLDDNEAKRHPVELAAEVHKNFVFIHPFVDGNGRVARLLMNLVLMRHDYIITMIPTILRMEYISLLEKAHYEASDFTNFIMDREIETQRELLRLISGKIEQGSVSSAEVSGPETLLQILKTHPGCRVPDLSTALKKSRLIVERYLRLLRNQVTYHTSVIL